MTGYDGAAVATFSASRDSRGEQSELVARAVAGDRDAFVSIYRAHFAEVRAFAERLLGCRMTADDLTHDLFVRMPEALRGFRGECPLRNYLISVAIRMARDYLRSAKRRRAREQQASLEPPDAPHSPERSMEEQELAQLLTIALDCLPLDQRVAFVLCEVEDKTSVEAAELLGEAAGTVRARVFHARKRLREQLAALAKERGLASGREGSRE
jgi:RNA polymerase sigma-70 factor, ECF subfamily